MLTYGDLYPYCKDGPYHFTHPNWLGIDARDSALSPYTSLPRGGEVRTVTSTDPPSLSVCSNRSNVMSDSAGYQCTFCTTQCVTRWGIRRHYMLRHRHRFLRDNSLEYVVCNHNYKRLCMQMHPGQQHCSPEDMGDASSKPKSQESRTVPQSQKSSKSSMARNRRQKTTPTDDSRQTVTHHLLARLFDIRYAVMQVSR